MDALCGAVLTYLSHPSLARGPPRAWHRLTVYPDTFRISCALLWTCGNPCGTCAMGRHHRRRGAHSAAPPAATPATIPRPMNRADSMPDYPHLSRIIAEAGKCAPLTTAVVMPTEPTALAGALEAAQSGLVIPDSRRTAWQHHAYRARGRNGPVRIPHCGHAGRRSPRRRRSGPSVRGGRGRGNHEGRAAYP